MMTKREFMISKESKVYMTMLAKRVGINLMDYNEDALYNRIVRRLRILRVTDFDEYCYRLRIDLNEEIKFINLLTNITTYFFRENHHFEYLKHHILPELVSQKKKMRIWSSACSTGEEPYSIAMTIQETIRDLAQRDIKILATDVNSDALSTAESGIYKLSDIRKMNEQRQKLWFSPMNDTDKMFGTINPELKSLVTFRELNLMHTWPFHHMFDIIFCRNVLIYFNQEIVDMVLNRLDRVLNPGGYLILGYTESLNEIKKHYVSLGNTIYQKVSS